MVNGAGGDIWDAGGRVRDGQTIGFRNNKLRQESGSNNLRRWHGTVQAMDKI